MIVFKVAINASYTYLLRTYVVRIFFIDHSPITFAINGNFFNF